MRTVLSKIILLAVVFLNQNVFSNEIVKLNRSVNAFVDHTAIESVFLISLNGQSSWLHGINLENEKTYNIVDKDCVPATQNTMLMGDEANGMTLAFPFLVGVERVCFIDDKTNSIRLLANFSNKLPTNAFTVAYAAQDATAVYFLINGREETADTGYIQLLTINKKDLSVSLRSLFSGVPGFSAAMVLRQDTIWITTWLDKNSLYKITQTNLLAEIQKKSPSLDFEKSMVKINSAFEGMSTFMLGNDNGFLFYNKGFENYVVNTSNFQRLDVTPACEPVAGYKDQWLVLCDGNRIENWTAVK